MKARLFLALSATFATFACGGGNDNLPPPPAPPPAGPEPTMTAPAASTTAPPAATNVPPPAPPVSLTLGTAAPDPAAPLPVVKIAAPRASEVIPADKVADFAVKLDVKNWQTAAGNSHVHLILDNKPYKRIDDTKVPVKMSELTGSEALAEGQHVLVAFASRASHESVKTKDALAVISFYVGKKATDTVDVKKPMLIYSRPKGDYNGENANHVLVDFYVANKALDDGKSHVGITVTGPGIDKPLDVDVTKWGAPYYLDNLQNGSYSVKMELHDKDNVVVPGPWNSTTRTIKINHDAPTDNPHAGHTAPAASGTAPTPPATAAPKPAGTAPKPAGTAKPKK